MLLRRGIISSGRGGIFNVNSANLDGSTQHFNNTAYTLPAFTELSFSCWINLDIVSGVQAVFYRVSDPDGNNNRSIVCYTVADEIFVRFYYGTGGTDFVEASFGTVTAGSWYHLCATCKNSGSINTYLDSALANTVSFATRTLHTGSHADYIGDNLESSQALDGKLSLYCLYTEELNSTKVGLLGTATCYSSMDSSIKTNLQSFWNLGNTSSSALPSGQELTDQTGNGHTLTNVGSTPFTGTGLNVEC